MNSQVNSMVNKSTDHSHSNSRVPSGSKRDIRPQRFDSPAIQKESIFHPREKSNTQMDRQSDTSYSRRSSKVESVGNGTHRDNYLMKHLAKQKAAFTLQSDPLEATISHDEYESSDQSQNIFISHFDKEDEEMKIQEIAYQDQKRLVPFTEFLKEKMKSEELNAYTKTEAPPKSSRRQKSPGKISKQAPQSSLPKKLVENAIIKQNKVGRNNKASSSMTNDLKSSKYFQ